MASCVRSTVQLAPRRLGARRPCWIAATGDGAPSYASVVADAAAQLPIGEVLPSILEALEEGPSLVLEAPPGAGKTTLVPLALLAHAGWLDGGRVVVLEPRRLAAKAAARRMAAALGERVGGTVGYSVRGDSATSNRTRVEVVTTGVLLRRLQRDPSLAGIACVLLDEFHERGCDADLALALAAQSQALLRPELRIAIMSATLGGTLAAQCQAVLSSCKIIQSAGRAFPVQVRHLAEPGRGRGELEEATAQAVQLALREVAEGDCLVFLPGAPEIRRVLRLLEGAVGSASVMPLFGDLAQEAQDAALAPPPPGVRRVILSSAIAESSLTIPGVRIVVDSGLSRRAAFSPANGLSRLVTVRTSGASEAQRAGRAGRTAPGFCYRLYGAAAGAQREEQTPPEILSADLAPLALELAVWGASAESLAWVTPPPAAALQAAALLLRRLGTLTEAGAPSEHGRACAALGVHPRLAHMIARAAEAGPAAARLACSVAALLEERDLLRKGSGAIVGGPGADLRLRLAALEGRLGDGAPELGGWDVDRGVQARVRDSARLLYGQLLDALGEPAPAAAPLDGTHAVGLLLALAYPDRVGASRSGRAGAFALASGKTAQLQRPQEEPLSAHSFLAVAEVDGDPTSPRVFSAAPLPQDAPQHPWLASLVTEEERVFWNPSSGSVGARRVRTLGSILLSEAVLPAPQGEAAVAGVIVGIREHLGFAGLKESRASRAWRSRVRFLAASGVPSSAGLPDLSDVALLASLESWLAPFLAGVSTKAQLAQVDVDAALRCLLSRDQQRLVEELTPTHFAAPSGSQIAIDYESAASNGGVPVVELRLQECFGFAESPKIAGIPLCLSLLSPAGREVARTSDLASFWRGAYVAVRKDLRGRYPKHPWPEDPMAAQPTSRRKPVGT